MLHNVVVRNTCVQQKPPDLSVGSVTGTKRFRNRAAIYNLLLTCEALTLIALTYFFWYPSSFPAATSATGITPGEWQWIAVLLVAPAMLATLINAYPPAAKRFRRAPVLLMVAAAWLLLAVLYLRDNPPAADVDRADYIVLLVPLMLVLLLHSAALRPRAVWPLLALLAAFMALAALSVAVAPYETRGLRMLARPALGVALVLYFVILASHGRLVWALYATLALCIAAGAVALTATAWTSKSDDFRAIIDALPRWDLFFAPGGFNPNEIAGGLAPLIPLSAGLALYRWPARPWMLRALAAAAGLMLLLALGLGQSRFAIGGAGVGLVVLALTRLRARPRIIAMTALAGLVVLQAAILLNLLPAAESTATPDTAGLSARDERTINQRLDIWRSAADLLVDYPLTGVGLNNFRAGPVRRDYPIESLSPPHAHNNFIQVAADLGIPGLFVYIAWTAALVYMSRSVWRAANANDRTLVMAAGAALLAHYLYSIGDAVPLWDRLSFIYWIPVGVITGQYLLIGNLQEKRKP